MRFNALPILLAGLPQLPADYPMLDPEKMDVTSTKDAPAPEDDKPKGNRHERRKAAKLNR